MVFERFSEKKLLTDFEAVHLDEMKNVELMNRTDTKFVFSREKLGEFFPILKDEYKVLEVAGTRMSSYSTLYYDTEGYRFYLAHHNGKGNRHKVRIRKYIDSDVHYLEVKNKYKGRTRKKRITIGGFEKELSQGSNTFIEAVIGEDLSLESKLWNSFERITLVNKYHKERVTIDVNLGFKKEDQEGSYEHFAIAELKQERLNRQSLFYQLMKSAGIRKNTFSKYCVGTITMNQHIKYNAFKQHLRIIEKLR